MKEEMEQNKEAEKKEHLQKKLYELLSLIKAFFNNLNSNTVYYCNEKATKSFDENDCIQLRETLENWGSQIKTVEITEININGQLFHQVISNDVTRNNEQKTCQYPRQENISALIRSLNNRNIYLHIFIFLRKYQSFQDDKTSIVKQSEWHENFYAQMIQLIPRIELLLREIIKNCGNEKEKNEIQQCLKTIKTSTATDAYIDTIIKSKIKNPDEINLDFAQKMFLEIQHLNVTPINYLLWVLYTLDCFTGINPDNRTMITNNPRLREAANGLKQKLLQIYLTTRDHQPGQNARVLDNNQAVLSCMYTAVNDFYQTFETIVRNDSNALNPAADVFKDLANVALIPHIVHHSPRLKEIQSNFTQHEHQQLYLIKHIMRHIVSIINWQRKKTKSRINNRKLGETGRVFVNTVKQCLDELLKMPLNDIIKEIKKILGEKDVNLEDFIFFLLKKIQVSEKNYEKNNELQKIIKKISHYIANLFHIELEKVETILVCSEIIKDSSKSLSNPLVINNDLKQGQGTRRNSVLINLASLQGDFSTDRPPPSTTLSSQNRDINMGKEEIQPVDETKNENKKIFRHLYHLIDEIWKTPAMNMSGNARFIVYQLTNILSLLDTNAKDFIYQVITQFDDALQFLKQSDESVFSDIRSYLYYLEGKKTSDEIEDLISNLNKIIGENVHKPSSYSEIQEDPKCLIQCIRSKSQVSLGKGDILFQEQAQNKWTLYFYKDNNQSQDKPVGVEITDKEKKEVDAALINFSKSEIIQITNLFHLTTLQSIVKSHGGNFRNFQLDRFEENYGEDTFDPQQDKFILDLIQLHSWYNGTSANDGQFSKSKGRWSAQLAELVHNVAKLYHQPKNYFLAQQLAYLTDQTIKFIEENSFRGFSVSRLAKTLLFILPLNSKQYRVYYNKASEESITLNGEQFGKQISFQRTHSENQEQQEQLVKKSILQTTNNVIVANILRVLGWFLFSYDNISSEHVDFLIKHEGSSFIRCLKRMYSDAYLAYTEKLSIDQILQWLMNNLKALEDAHNSYQCVQQLKTSLAAIACEYGGAITIKEPKLILKEQLNFNPDDEQNKEGSIIQHHKMSESLFSHSPETATTTNNQNGPPMNEGKEEEKTSTEIQPTQNTTENSSDDKNKAIRDICKLLLITSYVTDDFFAETTIKSVNGYLKTVGFPQSHFLHRNKHCSFSNGIINFFMNQLFFNAKWLPHATWLKMNALQIMQNPREQITEDLRDKVNFIATTIQKDKIFGKTSRLADVLTEIHNPKKINPKCLSTLDLSKKLPNESEDEYIKNAINSEKSTLQKGEFELFRLDSGSDKFNTFSGQWYVLAKDYRGNIKSGYISQFDSSFSQFCNEVKKLTTKEIKEAQVSKTIQTFMRLFLGSPMDKIATYVDSLSPEVCYDTIVRYCVNKLLMNCQKYLDTKRYFIHMDNEKKECIGNLKKELETLNQGLNDVLSTERDEVRNNIKKEGGIIPYLQNLVRTQIQFADLQNTIFTQGICGDMLLDTQQFLREIEPYKDIELFGTAVETKQVALYQTTASMR